MASSMNNRVFKGSGYIFCRKHTASVTYPAVADMASMTDEEATAIDAFVRALATAENELGYLKNGITFTENITALQDQDDMGRLKVNDLQSEDANAAFSLFNANAATIAKVNPLSKTAANTTKKIALTNMGGIANKDDSEYDILFVHPDTEFGDICVYSLAKNITGLTIGFQPSAVTPLACNFAAQAIDTTGVLYKISEHEPGNAVYTPGSEA